MHPQVAGPGPRARPRAGRWSAGASRRGRRLVARTTPSRAYLAAVAADPRQDSWLGFVDDEPTFLVETYEPTTVLLAGVPEVRAGDLGMHLLVAPPTGAPSTG